MSIGNLKIENCYFPPSSALYSTSSPSEKIKELFDESSEELKGSGTFGSVFKVTHLLDFQDYALKLSSSDRDSAYDQLLNEVEKLKLLNHKQNRENKSYVPDLIAYFLLENQRLAMQLPLYLKDMDPESNTDRLSIEQTFPFLKTMLDILCFLKRHGVIHLDIKPENVFLTGEGTYILGDFGASIFEGHGPDADCRIGTLIYSAPEVLVSSKFAHFPADMWSTAATICRVYGGIFLFGYYKGDSIISVSQIQQHRFQRPYPRELQESIRKQDIERRFLCEPSEFNRVRPFEMAMETHCRPSEKDRNAHQFLLSLLNKMFDFDRSSRIEPENALIELSSIMVNLNH